MNYLLNNIEVEIDIDQSDDLSHAINFKVYNKSLQTFWLVEHSVEEIDKFSLMTFNKSLPEENWEKYNWIQEICRIISSKQQNEPRVLEFFKLKPTEMKRKPSKKRSLSTFSQLLKMSATEEVRTQSRNTVSQKQKQYTQIILETSTKYCDLQTTRDYIDFLSLLNYKEIRKVGAGTQSQAFKALNQQGHLVAVKISQNTQENLQAALMQRQINQEVADNFIGNYLFQYQILEVEDILIVEEELAQNTLEDLMIQKQESYENFTHDEINTIMKDIVDQLFNLHISRRSAHNDIKPENILIQDGKFILHDFGAIKFVPQGSDEVEINQILGTVLYMSPIKLRHYLSMNLQQHELSMTQSINTVSNDYKHNPFKSDIYSVGLVLLRLLLHNDRIFNKQIECIFFDKRFEMIPEMIEKYHYYLYPEKFFYFDKLCKIQPLLTLLLQEDEQSRISTLELACLFNSPLTASISTPFTQQFRPSCWKVDSSLNQLGSKNDLEQYQIAYSLKQLIYEGGYCKEERKGEGTMYKAQKNDLLFRIFKYKKDKKTINEEELECDESSITQLQESKHLSAKQSLVQVQNQCQILYKGAWEKNLPHGLGYLYLYNTIQDFSYKETFLDYGKLINKNDDHQEEQQILISSQFYYGLLNGKTTVSSFHSKSTVKDQNYYYILNISSRLMTSVFEVACCYYKFDFDKQTNLYYGYEQPYDFTVIDVLDINDQKIITDIISAFISNLRTKITHFEIKISDDEKQIQLIDQVNNYIFVRFRPKIQNFKSKLPIQERKEKKTTYCCFGGKQKQHPQSKDQIEVEILSDDLESQIVTECLSRQRSYLNELNLKNNSLSQLTLKWLFFGDAISNIVTLNLSNTAISDTFLADVLISQYVTMVKDLDVSYTQLSIKTVNALINSENLNQLHKLKLAGCYQCQSFTDFIVCDKAQQLTLLDISENRWVDWDLVKQFSTIYLPNLVQLNLSETGLSLKEFSKFQQSPFGRKLKFMNAKPQQSEITEFKITINTHYSMFYHIRYLENKGYSSEHDFEENTVIKDETLKRISYSQGLQNIVCLNLSRQRIQVTGMKYLFQSQFITNIISINLSETPVDGEVLKLINQSKLLHLKILKLRHCDKIDYPSLQNFVKNYRAAQLQKFYLSSRQITTKKLVLELKNIQSLVKGEVIINQQERQLDISDLLKSILTWVAIQINQRKFLKFSLDISNCKFINDGFSVFLDEIKNTSSNQCKLIINVKKYKYIVISAAISKDTMKQLGQYGNINFLDQ